MGYTTQTMAGTKLNFFYLTDQPATLVRSHVHTHTYIYLISICYTDSVSLAHQLDHIIL